MAFLTDFYVANEPQANGYDTAPEGYELRASYKGITPLELSTLWASMAGGDPTADLAGEFENVLTVDGGQRLIYRFPTKLVGALAGLKEESIGALAATWAKTDEELISMNADGPDVEPIIEDLARLARRAVDAGSGLYLWICV